MRIEFLNRVRSRLRAHVADACLLGAVLLVLALSWQDAGRRAPAALGEAARDALGRHLGEAPAAPAPPAPAVEQAGARPARSAGAG